MAGPFAARLGLWLASGLLTCGCGSSGCDGDQGCHTRGKGSATAPTTRTRCTQLPSCLLSLVSHSNNTQRTPRRRSPSTARSRRLSWRSRSKSPSGTRAGRLHTRYTPVLFPKGRPASKIELVMTAPFLFFGSLRAGWDRSDERLCTSGVPPDPVVPTGAHRSTPGGGRDAVACRLPPPITSTAGPTFPPRCPRCAPEQV